MRGLIEKLGKEGKERTIKDWAAEAEKPEKKSQDELQADAFDDFLTAQMEVISRFGKVPTGLKIKIYRLEL